MFSYGLLDMDMPVLTDQQKLDKLTSCRHRMYSRGPARINNWDGWWETDRQTDRQTDREKELCATVWLDDDFINVFIGKKHSD